MITTVKPVTRTEDRARPRKVDNKGRAFGEILLEELRKTGQDFRELKKEHKEWGHREGLYQLRG